MLVSFALLYYYISRVWPLIIFLYMMLSFQFSFTSSHQQNKWKAEANPRIQSSTLLREVSLKGLSRLNDS
jgi:hypothetical protein